MPTELPFQTFDVFTSTRYKGNPLAIVTIPPSLILTHIQKQLIAREFNLSETVFIHDVDASSPSSTRNIDIFLPLAEIPFAGHPTIGAAVSLADKNVTTLVTKAGPIPLRQTDLPKNLYNADNLQANPQIRDMELNAPVVSIVNGVTFILIELPSLEELAQVRQTAVEFPSEQFLDERWNNGLVARLYYVKMGETKYENGLPVVTLRTRMMEQSFEDPATGSAACCLGSYLSIQGDKQTTPSRRYDITQGVEMGKESNIVVKVQVKDEKIDTVHLAGTAVQAMRGFVFV
ncbi:hypothetical protein QQS21_010646 [Conoideocrella luteorostrata]|uniref:Phenazine biosynthesis protein n=1 Tax=Conoideocrella luteorostrata TaxID=1105319 RepID=A0AAJ0CES7_9HYPO|nr:hypothetical protein QQS21_010646 [Conoideocrella luteorostrata]